MRCFAQILLYSAEYTILCLFCFKSLQIRGVKPGFEYCFIVMMQVGRITKVLTGWLLSKCDPSVRPYIGSRAWGSHKMNLLELEGQVHPAERWIYSSSSLRKKLHCCMAAKLFGFYTLQRLLKKTRKVWAKNDWREGWWATCTWSWSSWVLRRRLGGWESWWGSMDWVHTGASGSRDRGIPSLLLTLLWGAVNKWFK